MVEGFAVVGASGFVGQGLAEALIAHEKDVVVASRRGAGLPIDLLSCKDFDYDSIAGRLVVMAAAVSSPAFCELHRDEAWAVNVKGTVDFIGHALEKGCRVLFLSSDAVYASESGEVYDELSDTVPRFEYGKMKLEVEHSFAENQAFKALRLSYVCAAKDKVTSYFLGCAERSERAQVYHPYYRSCTTLSDLVSAVEWLEGNWDDLPVQALNVAGCELVSRIRLADEIKCLIPSFSYDILEPDDAFYYCRPRVTQMNSKFLYDYGMTERKPFSIAYKSELEGSI